MAISFTPEQRQVIELHNCNVLVSAAAGSGKTAVLVERIVEMICDGEHPVDIDRLLVVTFTNAAAAEMRERIGQAIGDRLRENPRSAHLQRQATLLHNALITTIDSFSLFLLRNHFNEIGLDPAFRVADEGEIRLLQKETMEELLEDAFAEESEAFSRCVEVFCPGGKESVLEQNILNLSRYASSFPWPDEWLEERKRDYGARTTEELLDGVCGAYFRQYIERIVRGCTEKMEEAVKICEEPDGPYMYGELLEREREEILALQECGELQGFASRLEAVTFGRLPGKKDDSVNVYKREGVKELRGEVKDALQKLRERFFDTPFTLSLRQSMACEEPVETLLSLTLAFNRRLREKKQEKKLIDFSDMEHYALDILIDRKDGEIRPSAVALEYREFFEEILIDEYQDSNLVQEYLLKAVSGEEQGRYNRFMVGDVKQSIYKFRLARPELFLEKYARYGETGDFRRIDLSRNFRSREEVICSVNDIFSRIMSEECGGIPYDEKAMLYAGASYPGTDHAQTELILVEKPEKDYALTAKQAEALAIAGKIQELLNGGQVTDKETGAPRPVRYRDIVILLRTNSGWDEEFKSVLENRGIPVYISGKTGYFAATEVQELLNMLRVLNNPLQDIPLFGVLKSIFGGFGEEEIALIRGQRKDCPLYEALKAYAASGDSYGPVREKVGRFLQSLNEYRSYTIYLPIRELLQRLVEEHHYLSYVTALPGGSKRRANVEMLFTKASDFEKTSYFGLFHFIRYMEQLEKYDVDYGEADKLDENADVVRIMSIHKSKGLEFPVTFVAGLSKRFNMQDANQSLIVDMDLGLAVDYVDEESRIRNRTLRRQVISCKMREDNLSEELRVLYVALTRAREKLIMTAVTDRPSERLEALIQSGRHPRRLSYLDFMEAGSYLDLLLPVIGGTRIGIQIKELADLKGEELKEQVLLFDRREALRHAAEYADGEALGRLKERFHRQYPYGFLEGLYTKTTVSELKIAAMCEKDEAAFHAFEEKEVVPYLPAFCRKEESVTGTVRGNAYHKAMELLDFQLLLGKQFDVFPEQFDIFSRELDTGRLAGDLEEFLRVQTENFRLPGEYFKALQPGKLLHFMESELGWRMWRAQRRKRLYREQPFVLGIEASRLNETFPSEEKVLIQGIIDVFFEEEDGLVLLDYKTDVIKDADALWNRYEVQMDYYKEALERLMKKPVKERLLYSFSLQVTVE